MYYMLLILLQYVASFMIDLQQTSSEEIMQGVKV